MAAVPAVIPVNSIPSQASLFNFWTFKAVISVPKHFFFREMTFSSLADELVTAFDNEPTTSNSLAAEFGLDLDLDQEVGLQTRAGGDGLGYRGHSLGR